MSQVRDRLWLWAHPAGSHRAQYALPSGPELTPAQAAEILGLSNMIMVAYGGEPRPPLAPHGAPMLGLDRLVWSIIGDSSSTRNDEQSDIDEVLALAREMPNLVGGILDDFFLDPAKSKGRQARCSLEQLKSFADRLHSAPRRLDLWVVVYDLLKGQDLGPYLELCDVVTFWTWQAENLANVESNLKWVNDLAPSKKKLLGLYTWDFGNQRPMALSVFQCQCELGLHWLKSGKVDGLIFLSSCQVGLGIDTELWFRNWVKEVGSTVL